MERKAKYVFILTLKDIVIFAGSNLLVVYNKFKSGVPAGMQKGIKSYAQYCRDLEKCPTITIRCPYYGEHQISKRQLISKLNQIHNG